MPRPSGTMTRPRRGSSCTCARVMSVAGVARAGARCAGMRPADRLQRRGLAGAVRADQADQLALADVEVDALDRADAAVAHLQILAPQAACGAPEVGLDDLRDRAAPRPACLRRSSRRSRAPSRGRRRSSPGARRARSAAPSRRSPRMRRDELAQRDALGRRSCPRRARRARAASARWRARARFPGAAGRRRAGCRRASLARARMPT